LDLDRSELEGTASYYGEHFDGRPTASGEPFDMRKFSAAHRTMRLGTLVRVTNMDNGRSVDVCVNDRGPYAKDRVLDLSYAAAKELGVLAEGTAPVRIEIVGKK
jgi:rare lipoprotein A